MEADRGQTPIFNLPCLVDVEIRGQTPFFNIVWGQTRLFNIAICRSQNLPAINSGAVEDSATRARVFLETFQLFAGLLRLASGNQFGSIVAMPRPPRLQIAGATYHVMARGNRKQPIFHDVFDRRRFRALLEDVSADLEVSVLTECQMGNHFHAVITTPKPNVSRFMQRLDGRYGQYLNRRYKSVGHVFQTPFKAVIVEHDIHLLTEIAYVLMNPVTAQLVAHVADWKWSSYDATVGQAPQPAYLNLEWLSILFPAPTLDDSRNRFIEFIQSERPIQSYLDKNLGVVGTERFTHVIRSLVVGKHHGAALPRSLRALGRPALGEIFPPGVAGLERSRLIQRAHVVYGYTLEEIARTLALHPASVSRILCSLRARSRREV